MFTKYRMAELLCSKLVLLQHGWDRKKGKEGKEEEEEEGGASACVMLHLKLCC